MGGVVKTWDEMMEEGSKVWGPGPYGFTKDNEYFAKQVLRAALADAPRIWWCAHHEIGGDAFREGSQFFCSAGADLNERTECRIVEYLLVPVPPE